jgi:hypothetical protein
MVADIVSEQVAGMRRNPHPARRRISANDGRRGGRALGGADRLAAFGFALRTKTGRRPPVRRNVSAAGPPWL